MKSYLPAEFDVAIGGCFGPSFTVRLMNGRLMYEKSPGLYMLAEAVEIKPSQEQWERFWQQMDRIGLWIWEPSYEQCSAAVDGEHWFINISLNGRSVRSEGEGCYPGASNPGLSEEFEQFLNALRHLLGGAEFW